MKYGLDAFRIEYWPMAVAEVPPVPVSHPVELHDGFLHLGPKRSTRWVDDEVFLSRLFGLRLGDDKSLLSFSEGTGVLVPPQTDLLPIDLEPGLKTTLEAIRSKDGSCECAPGWSCVSFEEVRLYARVLRDIVRILDPQQRYAAEAPERRWSWESTWRPKPASIDEAAIFLGRVLNAGLEPYRFHFAAKTHRLVGTGGSTTPWLFSALCLQVANYLVEGAEYKECANCGSLFVRQDGRTMVGSAWKGKAKYCTPQCARRSADRAYQLRNTKPLPAHTPGIDPGD